MRWARAEVPARTALAGNPSDGHGGAVLAVCVEALRATVEVREAGADAAEPAEAAPLLAAAARRFHAHTGIAPRPHAWRLRTTIPREVGLAGSSAIVIAALRALADLHDAPLHPDVVARTALAVEVEDLGIAAGLQDRLVQAHGGLQHMEFGAEHGGGAAEELDPAGLPEALHVAWLLDAGGASGVVHAALNARATELAPQMAELAGHARAARDAVRAGDHAALGAAAQASFRIREELTAVDPRHVALVEAFVAAGGWANSTGSGGAVVGWAPDGPPRAALAALGAGVVAV